MEGASRIYHDFVATGCSMPQAVQQQRKIVCDATLESFIGSDVKLAGVLSPPPRTPRVSNSATRRSGTGLADSASSGAPCRRSLNSQGELDAAGELLRCLEAATSPDPESELSSDEGHDEKCVKYADPELNLEEEWIIL